MEERSGGGRGGSIVTQLIDVGKWADGAVELPHCRRQRGLSAIGQNRA